MSDTQTRHGVPQSLLGPPGWKNDAEMTDGLTNKNSTTISHVQASDLVGQKAKPMPIQTGNLGRAYGERYAVDSSCLRNQDQLQQDIELFQ